MSDCVGCNTCQGNAGPYVRQASDEEQKWIEDQVGDIEVTLGKVVKPVEGFESYAAEIKAPGMGTNITLILSDEYTTLELAEIANMLGRVMRSFFIRTRLYPLLADHGGIT